MFLVGLTGGIAAGKSTVASLWESLGASIVDADVLAREAVAPGSAGLAAVAETFDGVLTADDDLDRKALAARVFEDPAARTKLESIVHPIVRKLSGKYISEAKTPVVVYVVPLLVEADVDLPFDYVVTVEAPEPEQVKRLVATRGMTEAEALARIKSQTSAGHRANRADVILNSNQDKELLMRDARLLFERLQEMAK